MPFGRKPTDHFQQQPQQTQAETPREKFIRLGTSRMNRVLNTIKLLGNLASPAYEYTEQDIEDIKMSIVNMLSETLKKFQKHHRGEKVEFQFGEDAPASQPEHPEPGEQPPQRTRQREHSW